MADETRIGSVTVGVVPDATGIEQKLRDQIVPAAERVGDEAGTEMSDKIENKMDEGGKKSADKFGEKFRARLKAALDNLPPAKVEGDVTDVDRKIAEVGAEIKALHDQPLIDKRDTALALDQIMLKVAALKAEAASGVDIPVNIDTRSALSDLDTAIQKIRGKAVTGALVPGGMFPGIPFSGSNAEKLVAAAQQAQAASVPGLGMNDIFVEAQAIQVAKEAAAAAARIKPYSVAGVPLAANEVLGDISGATGPARAKMFSVGESGMADIIQGVIGKVAATSWDNPTFIAGMDGVAKAAYSMSKEVELFRKPVGDIVKFTGPLKLAMDEAKFAREYAERYIAQDYTGRRQFVGGTRARTGALSATEVLEGIIHPPGEDIFGKAGFAVGTEGETIARSFSTELVKFEKPMGDIVKWTQTATEEAAKTESWRTKFFNMFRGAFADVKKMAIDVSRMATIAKNVAEPGVRGLVSRSGSLLSRLWSGTEASAPAATWGAGIPQDVISAMEARMKSGVPVSGSLAGFMRFMQSDAAKAMGTPSEITPDFISEIQQRMASGVAITGELNKFARFLKSDAASAMMGGGPTGITDELIADVRKRMETGVPLTGELNRLAAFMRSDAGKRYYQTSKILEAFGAGGGDIAKLHAQFGRTAPSAPITQEMLSAFGGGGGDIQKLLAEFGRGPTPAPTRDLLTAFGKGGGDLGKLLKDFGMGVKDIEGVLGEAGGGGGGGIGGFLGKMGGFFGGLPGQAGGLLGKIPLAGGNPWAGAGIGALGLSTLPFIGQGLAGAGVGFMGTALAGLGIAGAVHGLSTATTPAQIAAARQQQVAATDQVTAAQLRLNALQKSGTATAFQLSLAHQQVAAAQLQQTKASQALSDAIANKMTPAQEGMSNALQTFSSDFGDFMKKIGVPFVPVITNILKMADAVGKVMTPVFAKAEGIIAPAVQNIAGTLIKALGQPAVQQSILAVAKAFVALLNALSPNIVNGIGAIANSITNMANAVAANPRPFADFIKFLFGVVNASIQVIAWLTRVADWIEKQKAFWGAISKGFDTVIGNIKAVIQWLGHFEGFWKGVWATAKIEFDIFAADVKLAFDVIGTAVKVGSDIIHGRWGKVGSDIAAGAKKMVPVVKTAMGQVSNAVLGALGIHHTATAQVATSHHVAVATHLTHTQNLFRAHAASMAGIAAGNVVETTSAAHKHATTHLTNTQNLFRAHATNIASTAGTTTKGGGKGIAEPFIAGWNGAANATKAGISEVGKLIHGGLASFNNWWKTHGQAVKQVWNAIWHNVKIGFAIGMFEFKFFMAIIKAAWHLFWDYTKGVVKADITFIKTVIEFAWHFIEDLTKLVWHTIEDAIKIAWDIIIGIVNIALDLLTGHWHQAWNDMLSMFKQVWNAMLDWFKSFWTTVENTFKNLFNSLKTIFVTAGGDIIGGLFAGIKAAFSDISNFVSTYIYHPILDHIKSFFGIKSPASKMKPIGKEIIGGVFHGMLQEGKHIEQFAAKIFGGWPKAILSFVTKGMVGGMTAKLAGFLGSALGWAGGAAKKAAGFFSGIFHAVAGGGAGGVARWAGTVGKALTMLRLPQTLAGDVLYQMQTESGGNPNIINTWDSNAKAGHPSQGLMQVIPSTFQAYHVAGTSWNILDPLANIAAALNYAKHNRGFGAGAGQIGSGHGYDEGGWLPTGVTLAMNNTGKPERILTDAQWKSLYEGGGPEYHAHFDGLTTQAIQAEVRTAFHMMNLTSGQLARPGRRT